MFKQNNNSTINELLIILSLVIFNCIHELLYLLNNRKLHGAIILNLITVIILYFVSHVIVGQVDFGELITL
jgi:hypothetical protein